MVDFEPASSGGSADEVVEYWVSRLIQRPIDDGKRKSLVEALGEKPENEQSVKRMVQLIVSMPEYQLC